jgi:hypothetical protein
VRRQYLPYGKRDFLLQTKRIKMESLLICTESELIAALDAEISNISTTLSRPPTWAEIWEEVRKKMRTVTLNLWECVKNRRWFSSSSIGTLTGSGLVALLLEDLGECAPGGTCFPEGSGSGGSGGA